MTGPWRGDPADMLGRVGRHWGWTLGFGIITVLAGIVPLAWPGPAVIVCVWLRLLGCMEISVASRVRAALHGAAAHDPQGSRRDARPRAHERAGPPGQGTQPKPPWTTQSASSSEARDPDRGDRVIEISQPPKCAFPVRAFTPQNMALPDPGNAPTATLRPPTSTSRPHPTTLPRTAT